MKMSITARALREAGFTHHSSDNIEFCFDNFEYMYSIPEQTLYFVNDGFGEPEEIARYTVLEELLQALESLLGSRDPEVI